jgi:hypothetical protein
VQGPAELSGGAQFFLPHFVGAPSATQRFESRNAERRNNDENANDKKVALSPQSVTRLATAF